MRDWVSFAEIKSQVKLAEVLRCYGGRRLAAAQRPAASISRALPDSSSGARHGSLPRASGAGRVSLFCLRRRRQCSGLRRGDGRLLRAGSSLTVAGVSWPGRPPRWGAGEWTQAKGTGYEKREVNPALSFALNVDSRHSYLARRGLNPITVDHFGVGYYGARGLMQGRIAIPIHDDQGRRVAYCGRALGDDAPRYRFPAGFQKAQVLFNYHRARATSEHQVIVVEGFFDCMRVHQADYPCVVALMGARLSVTQKELLADRFASVVLLLDGDQTGRTATAQVARDLAPACSVTQVLLPLGMQPDQMAAADIRHALTGEERRQEIGANRPI